MHLRRAAGLLKLTLAVAAHEASFLQAVVVIPASVLVHLHTVLVHRLPRVERCVGLSRSPVEEAQRRLICPGPADCKHTQRFRIIEVGAHVYVAIIKAEVPL